jgi:hypothetical protein
MVRLKPDTTTLTLVVEKYWRRRETGLENADFLIKDDGGGGSRAESGDRRSPLEA